MKEKRAMSLFVDKGTHSRKKDILDYFRHRAQEALSEIVRVHGEAEFKERANAINRAVQDEKDRLLLVLGQKSRDEKWSNEDVVKNALVLTHCANVVMIEARNSVWPYDYMAFSRRVGELWEPFCNLCFEYPLRGDVRLFIPPLFDDVRKRMNREIRDFIATLPLTKDQSVSLVAYYEKVWSLVMSGEIKLTLDLHFSVADVRYVVDFKSGFGSNEKGNTNRLLLVASVYKNIEHGKHECLLLVRSKEDENNNYLQTLKNSGLWSVYCGADAYAQVAKYSGFNISAWIQANIDWTEDLAVETRDYLKAKDLLKYLAW